MRRQRAADYATHYGLDDPARATDPVRRRAAIAAELRKRTHPDGTVAAADLLAVHCLVGVGAGAMHVGRGFRRADVTAAPLPPHRDCAFDQVLVSFTTTTVVVTVLRLLPSDPSYDIYEVRDGTGHVLATTFDGTWTSESDQHCLVDVPGVVRLELHGQRGASLRMGADRAGAATTSTSGAGPVLPFPEPLRGRGYQVGGAVLVAWPLSGGGNDRPAAAPLVGLRRWGTVGGTTGVGPWLTRRLHEAWVGGQDPETVRLPTYSGGALQAVMATADQRKAVWVRFPATPSETTPVVVGTAVIASVDPAAPQLTRTLRARATITEKPGTVLVDLAGGAGDAGSSGVEGALLPVRLSLTTNAHSSRTSNDKIVSTCILSAPPFQEPELLDPPVTGRLLLAAILTPTAFVATHLLVGRLWNPRHLLTILLLLVATTATLLLLP